MLFIYIIKKIFKAIGRLLFTIISLISLVAFSNHDKRDPIKRYKDNSNFLMLAELDKAYSDYSDKPINLVLDLDGTLVYCHHKEIKGYEYKIVVNFSSGE
jgi:hypothetical protein